MLGGSTAGSLQLILREPSEAATDLCRDCKAGAAPLVDSGESLPAWETLSRMGGPSRPCPRNMNGAAVRLCPFSPHHVPFGIVCSESQLVKAPHS